MTPNPETPFLLDFGHGSPVRLDLRLPLGEVTVHDLIPSIFDVAESIHNRSIQQVEALGKRIGCGARCSACCSQLVPVSEYEAAYLAGVVRALPGVQRSRIIQKFTMAIQRLDEAGLMSVLNETFARDLLNEKKVLELKKAYWKLNIACPFLEEGSCSIYEHRPLVCRQYSVTSDSSHCDNIYSDQAAHEVVVHPVDAGGALAAFSGAGIQESRVLPLIFSLLAERSIRSQPLPLLPAAQMMGRYLNLLAECFSRH